MKDTGDKMFKLHSKYTPMGDQPEAIKKIVENIRSARIAANSCKK